MKKDKNKSILTVKRYTILFGFDDVDGKFVAVCPEFFGFIAYYDTFEELKRKTIKLLKVYAKNEELTGKDVDFAEIQTKEMEI